MDKDTKQAHADLAQFAEDRANEQLDKALDFAARHGPQAVVGELTEAGSLLSAAEALRARAK